MMICFIMRIGQRSFPHFHITFLKQCQIAYQTLYHKSPSFHTLHLLGTNNLSGSLYLLLLTLNRDGGEKRKSSKLIKEVLHLHQHHPLDLVRLKMIRRVCLLQHQWNQQQEKDRGLMREQNHKLDQRRQRHL
jgi:hypothetical protein